MAKAVWNGQTLAESEKTEMVEGNLYFPEETVKREFLKTSSTTSSCPWKGQARYYTILVDGQENPDAAWYYPDPKPAARNVKNHIRFWRGVKVTKEPSQRRKFQAGEARSPSRFSLVGLHPIERQPNLEAGRARFR